LTVLGLWLLTWGIALALILLGEQLAAIFGELSASNPLFILAVYGPGIVAVGLVLWHYGRSGVGGFLSRLALWRLPLVWWAFLIVGVPAAFYLGAALTGSIDDPFPFSPWTAVLPALASAIFLGPIEEFGWRGVALPLLQRRFAPLWAGLILGVIWAVWHIPAFLLSGTPQEAWSFAPYFVGVVSLSVIVTPMFNASRGSLLIPVLFHFQANNPIWPDAQPWDNWLFAAVAVVIVVLNWRTMTDRDAGVTDVVPGDGRDRPGGQERAGA